MFWLKLKHNISYKKNDFKKWENFLCWHVRPTMVIYFTNKLKMSSKCYYVMKAYSIITYHNIVFAFHDACFAKKLQILIFLLAFWQNMHKNTLLLWKHSSVDKYCCRHKIFLKILFKLQKIIYTWIKFDSCHILQISVIDPVSFRIQFQDSYVNINIIFH